MIHVFTPSFADEADTNAQNLSVKEIVSRMEPGRFAVTMLHEREPDRRIATRPNTRLIRWRKHGNTIRAALDILTRVPDVYFFPREGPLDAAFLNLRRMLKLKTALVTYVVSGGLHLQPYAPARVKNIHAADAVVANNIHLAKLLKEKMGVDASIIYDGIDRRYFFPPERRPASSDGIAVLYAGSMRPYKRVPIVVREAARHRNVRFRIAGIGEEERTCRNLALELNCKNVDFLGHLALRELGEEMRRADIFFFPSAIEGHPQVLGQAAACGLPVICSRTYLPDYVVDGTTGFLAETDEELSEKLGCLIREVELRRAMSLAAISHADKFNWDAVTREWQQVFESIVNDSLTC